ncbi:MAG TPA: hypothetical protein VGM32_15185 [Rhodopila sp.]|jgi:hypothetical protein
MLRSALIATSILGILAVAPGAFCAPAACEHAQAAAAPMTQAAPAPAAASQSPQADEVPAPGAARGEDVPVGLGWG